MGKISVLKAMKILGRPVFTTRELAAISGYSFASTCQSLRQLANEELVKQIKRGVWADIHSSQFSPFRVINFLLPRHRAYLSFISALHLHGIISQIPEITNLASTAHSRIIRTPVAVYSIHQIAPSFFDGFDWYRGGGEFLIAEPEKALVDCLYIATRKGRKFAHFPELSMSAEFKSKAIAWTKRIPDSRIRTSVLHRLEVLFGR